MSNGAASSFTVASPLASLATIARRVGSASAAKVASSRSPATVMIGLLVATTILTSPYG
jgi:uncharacterized membrane protein